MQQLAISKEGLEKKIAELESHLKWLREPERHQTRRFVYEMAHEIERDCYTMAILMGACARVVPGRSKLLPKIVRNDDVFQLASQIQLNLSEVFDFVRPQVDVERAKRYWQDIAEWRGL